MTDLDAARPPRKRKTIPVAVQAQKQATESLFKGLDRFGLAPILLIGLAYIGHTQVIVPIANAYAKMVEAVAENNRLLREAIDKNNKEDGERVLLISKAEDEIRKLSEENRELNQQILALLGEIVATMRAKSQ